MRSAVMERDWYTVLEVSPEASAEVIAAAHRVLVKRYHPDIPGGDLERMKLVNLARDVLGDVRLRREFDRTRTPVAPSRAPESAVPVRDVPVSAPVVPASPPAVREPLRERVELVLGRILLAGRILVGLVLGYAALELVVGVVWLVWTLATR